MSYVKGYGKVGTLGEALIESGVLDQLKLKDARPKKKKKWQGKKQEKKG